MTGKPLCYVLHYSLHFLEKYPPKSISSHCTFLSLFPQVYENKEQNA